MFHAAGIFSLIFGGLIALQTRWLGDYDEKFRGGTKQARDERARRRYYRNRAEEKKAHKQWLVKKQAARRAKKERERDEEERVARGEYVRSRRSRHFIYGVESGLRR